MKEASKFLSGAFFVQCGVNIWMYYHSIPAPLLGMEISPDVLGIRGLIFGVLFILTFYFGFLKQNKQS
ncbi:MAG: hypothetical protein K0S44_2898 [Bacteroidetes bacterium]|nr:hypothetical protein [Bacteroidota bacterium]